MLTNSCNSLLQTFQTVIRRKCSSDKYIRKSKSAEVSIQPTNYVSGNTINIGNLLIFTSPTPLFQKLKYPQ